MIVGVPLLDWALVAISTFNIVVSIWLGMTILLNAERRTAGVWMAGLGMLCAAGFFGFHALMLDGPFLELPIRLQVLWYPGWLPIILLPYGWYLALVWFSGFWDRPRAERRMVHRIGVWLLGVLAVLTFAYIVMLHQPIYLMMMDTPQFPELWKIQGRPEGLYIYAALIVGAIVLSLDAIRIIEPTGHVIADIARRRARPWLMATSMLQVMVALLVAGTMVWLFRVIGKPFDPESLRMPLAGVDVMALLLIAAAIALMGYAVVSYEIFTGKTLPRQGLRRHWRGVLVLGALAGAATGAAMQLRLPRFWLLLAAALVMAAFYALVNWRSYRNRERYLAHLRPFVGSGRMYEGMLEVIGDRTAAHALDEPFRALAGDVLGARLAHLVPLGAVASFMARPLSYPAGTVLRRDAAVDLAALASRPGELCVPLDPDRNEGALWLIPLWSERGTIGALLLGEKLDGGLYTQEEMEIARASGERLIDQFAATEMARRLVVLQRQRMSESQVADAHTRRVLHDDLLPQIHAALLALSAGGTSEAGGPDPRRATIEQLTGIHRAISDLLRELPMPAAPNIAKQGIIGTLRAMLGGELRGTFDSVEWDVDPAAEEELAHLPATTAEVIFFAAREAIRNAARYGRRAGTPLALRITLRGAPSPALIVEDNGPGISAEGPSNGGSGQGLTLHGTMMAVVGGALAIDSTPGHSTRVTLVIPHDGASGISS